MRFVFRAAGQTGIFVRFKIGKAHDHRFRPERRAQRRHSFDQFFNVKRHRIGVTGGVLFDRYQSYDIMWMISIGLGIFAALAALPIKDKTIVRQVPSTNPA